MLRWPAADCTSATSKSIIERFKKTAAAKDLEQDPREWVLESWPWVPDAPYTVVARSSDGEGRRCVMDLDGLWTIHVSGPTFRPSAA